MLKKLFIVIFILIFLITLYFYLDTPSSNQHPENSALTNNLLASTQETLNSDAIEDNQIENKILLNRPQLENEKYIQSMYEKKFNDKIIGMIKNGSFNLKNYGYINAYEDPIKDFLRLDDLKKLENNRLNIQDSKKILGYNPLAEKISADFHIANNFLLGNDDRSTIVTELNQDNKKILITQKKSDNNEKMLAEYINRYIGEHNNKGAIYQEYTSQHIQGLTFVDKDYSYTINALNLSRDEFNQIIKIIE